MIPVSVPLDFPKIVPSNWDTWNSVWEENKKYIPKILTTNNAGRVHWVGFDIYVKPGVDATSIIKYECKNVNCPDLFPILFDNIEKLPIDVHVVRVLQSLGKVSAHQDFATESAYNSIRSILVDNNSKQTWWYEDESKNKYYLDLPQNTNTWWYDDAKIKHGTDFYIGHSKQLLMYRGPVKLDSFSNTIANGISKYPNHVIYV
jgi:hypothetical protein